MKEKNTFDEIIRKKLEEINSVPPANLWNKIEAGITNVPVETSKFLWKKLFLQISAAILLLGVVSSIIYLKIEDKKTNSSQTKIDIQNTNPILQTSEKEDNANTGLSSNSISTHSISTQAELPDNSSESADRNATSPALKNSQKSISEVKIISNVESKPQSITNKLQTNRTQIIPVKQPIKIENPTENILLSETPKANTSTLQKEETIATKEEKMEEIIRKEVIVAEPIVANLAIDSTNKNIKDEKPNPIFRYNPRNLDKYFIGATYGQEYLTNTRNINPAHNFNLNVSYQNINFWAQSGVGISYSKEESNYVLGYNRYEFDRTQFETDDLLFMGIDSITNLPIFQPIGHTINLYKNNEYSYNSIANDIYYNLRIPVLLGYRKDFKKMAYYFSCGVAYNIQLHKKTKGLLELDEKSKMISLFYPVKPRRSSNLEYLLSGGIAFKIAPRMSLNTELLMRIYQYNLYKNATNDSPTIWSTGLNIGLIYEL